MPKRIKKKKMNNRNNNSYLYWLFGTMVSGLFLTVLYTLLRNRPDTALSNPRIEVPSDVFIPPNFFSPVENKNKWLDSVTFSIDESFLGTKAHAVILNYIKRQKNILASISLTPANKLALSKTTIRWVPPSFIHRPTNVITRGFVLQPRQIGIVLHAGLTSEELRWTLLNEIHHVTVVDINLHKGKAIDGAFPFLNKQGEIDVLLREELLNAIRDIDKNVQDFFLLLTNKQRNAVEEKKISTYLKLIMNYRPMIYRVSSSISDTEVDVVKLEGKKDILYRNARPIVYKEGNEIELLCSANRDDSLLELTQAFFYDYNRSVKKMTTLYDSRYKSEGKDEHFRYSSLLAEISSEIDTLFTLKMKQVFAKRFKAYFDSYASSYLAAERTSHASYSRTLPQPRMF